MKKIAKLTAMVVAVMMIVGTLPAISVSAALQNYSYATASVNFTNLVKNTPTLTGLADNSKSTGYSMTNAGTGADFEPVTGAFGKSPDDTSLKINKIPGSTVNAAVGIMGKQVGGGNIGEGEYITMNWNWAFGDFEAERSLNVEFYWKNQSYSDRTKFSYGSDDKAVSDILTIFPDGRIRLFGKILDNQYYFNTNEWYNFEVRILGGRTTDEANAINAAKEEGAEDVVAVKSVAYLYVDGSLIGQKEINNAEDSATTIQRPGSVCTAQFVSKAVKYTDSTVSKPVTTYIDDIDFGKYKENSTFYKFKSYGDLSVASDKVYTDGIHLALKGSVSAQEFIESLTLGENVSSVKLLDETGTRVSDMTLEVKPGWFLEVYSDVWKVIGKDENNNDIKGYHSYKRKITDSLTFAKLNFEGSSYAFPGNVSITRGFYNSNTNYGRNDAINEYDKSGSYFGLRGGNASYVSYKYATTSQGPGEMKLYFDASSISADKYVLEFAALRKEFEGNFAQASLIAGGNLGTVVAISDGGVAVKTDDGDWVFDISKKADKTQDRWYKLALEVDSAENKVKVYVNGEYTGITRTTNGTSVLSRFGILCDNRETYDTTKGLVAIDDINIYSGSYKSEELEISSSDENVVKLSQDRFIIKGNMTAADFKAATGADAIYAYANGVFGNEITDANIADGDVAVFYGDDSTVVKYYDIELAPVINGVTFDTGVEGKITAKASIETRSVSNHIAGGGMLVIAKKDGNRLVSCDISKVDSFKEVKTHEFSATVDYAEGDDIVAYFWKDSLSPVCDCVPFSAQ